MAEVLLTALHACRGLRRDEKVAKRICGAGIVVTNALSDWLELEIRRGGRHYRQRYEKGAPQGPLLDVGPADASGTMVRFHPDPLFFPRTRFDPADVRRVLGEIAAEAPEVAISWRPHRTRARGGRQW
jgi:DNA gyrase subunit B